MLKYYNVPDSLVQAVEAGEMPSDEEKAQAASEADFAIIELQSPSMAMEYTDGRPQNLTYGEYTADAMREVSIGYDWYHAAGTLVQYNETPDESKGDYKSNRSRKGNTHAGTPENLELIQETVELMGDKPIIFILSMENPMVVSEFEPSVDAMLMYASMRALRGRIVEQLQNGALSRLDRGHLTANALAQAVQKGDHVACEAYRQGCSFLAMGIVSLINQLNPGKIVMGGRLAEIHPGLLLDTIYKEIESRTHSLLVGKITLEVNQLHPSPSLLGAGAYAAYQELSHPEHLLTAFADRTALYARARELA